jgi:hypothetical protein
LLGTPVVFVGHPGSGFCARIARLMRSRDAGVAGDEPRIRGEFRKVNSSKLLEQNDPHQAALKYTMADAPTTTRTKTSIRMAGSSTTRSALPVVVECISRIPTVAR